MRPSEARPRCEDNGSYIRGVTIPPRQSVRDYLKLAPSNFPGSDQAATYRISYQYRTAAYAEPARYVDPDAIWKGQIQSESVTICKE